MDKAAPRRGQGGGVSVARRRTLWALALQVAALAVLGWALLGGSWLDVRGQPRTMVLVDRSQSMQRDEVDQAVAAVARAARVGGSGNLQLIEFAGRVASSPAPGGAATHGLEPTATDIEAALQSALVTHAQTPLSSVVLVSDGHENAGDAQRALLAAREARLPVRWLALGRPAPPAHINEVLAPDRARIGQRVQLVVAVTRARVKQGDVQAADQTDPRLRVRATARAAGGQTQTAFGEVGTTGRALLELEARASGAMVVDVALEEAASGQTMHRMNDAAVVDIAPPAALLYVQGSSGQLAPSLLRGGWQMNVIAASRLDAQTDALDGLQAVVLDDVAIADASPRFWSTLITAVKDHGLGLMVLGGERAFARGGYRGSTLESVLPVLSEPAALDQPAAIVFAVDKSGSMGQGSGGVDRFQLAQRAVLETARGLSERDALGLLVFDAVPRVLIPLGPAAAGTAALARDWQTSPNGGTQLAPALDLAIGELERSTAPRRMLVLVTDGFVDAAPLSELRARLARARIETIALAVGPDADVDALQRVINADTGLVLRVDQAADLPGVMRSGVERRRARVERGLVVVQQVQPLPFAPATMQDWPALAGHAVTRPRAGATVVVQTQRGEPVIALHRVGRGRVVAVTSGFGTWTPRWPAWRGWPPLAGGLASWTSGARLNGAGAVVNRVAGGLQVEAEVPTVSGSPVAQAVSIAVDTPTISGRLLDVEHFAAGRVRATLSDAGPGLYTFVVSTPQGVQRQLHLVRQPDEGGTWGTSPALVQWRDAGLITAWEPDFQTRPRGVEGQRVDRWLLAVSLALFLCGVVLDRTRLGSAQIAQVLRTLRGRLAPTPGAG